MNMSATTRSPKPQTPPRPNATILPDKYPTYSTTATTQPDSLTTPLHPNTSALNHPDVTTTARPPTITKPTGTSEISATPLPILSDRTTNTISAMTAPPSVNPITLPAISPYSLAAETPPDTAPKPSETVITPSSIPPTTTSTDATTIVTETTPATAPTVPSAPMAAELDISTPPDTTIPTYPGITEDTSSEATENIEVKTKDEQPNYTPPSTYTAGNYRETMKLKLTLKSSSTTNFAVTVRSILQQTCLLLAQDIPTTHVTVSWARNEMILPCVTLMRDKF
ncbi:mucin-7-like [Dendropsophus ebraccatus]|uniref:mucin-7-like n=1 Tax=Dendropsophus ebraccatus TaxID=150705 RepID=UPI0038314AB4